MKSVAARIGSEPFRTTINTGTHQWVSDEPASLGGGDTGPAPYELLLSALGSCTVITMKMYADRKGWEMREVNCQLTHEKQTRESENGEGSQQVDVIVKRIRVNSDLDDAQIERLMQISSKCPVHRTLEGCAEIITLKEE